MVREGFPGEFFGLEFFGLEFFGLEFFGLEFFGLEFFGLEFFVLEIGGFFVAGLLEEPLKLVGRFPFEVLGTLLQFPLFPPTFFFNQSRPLLTALSAMCRVTLLTLFAMLSKILEHFVGGGLGLNGV